MRTGKLDRTISIATVTPGEPLADGTPTDAVTETRTVRAQQIEASTEEYMRGYGEGGNTAVVFRIRWLPGVEVDQTITYSGKTFNVREIKELGRREALELRCEQVRS